MSTLPLQHSSHQKIPIQSTETLIHAFIISRIEYLNGIMIVRYNRLTRSIVLEGPFDGKKNFLAFISPCLLTHDLSIYISSIHFFNAYFINPCFINPRLLIHCFINPHFINPRFINLWFLIHVLLPHVLPIQSSPVVQ